MSIKSVMPSNHLILCHPFSSCPQSFPASGFFPISQLFASGGQTVRAEWSVDWRILWKENGSRTAKGKTEAVQERESREGPESGQGQSVNDRRVLKEGGTVGIGVSFSENF